MGENTKVDLKDVPTHELVEELKSRAGVDYTSLTPYTVKGVNLKLEGPAKILIVYD